MAQHDYILDNQPGASFRADLNAALAAIVTSNSGASAPSPTYPYQRWMDTTNNVERRRNAANTAWIDVATLLESFVVDRSSNTAWTRADRGRVFRVTGSYTQTANAAATLGDGWSVAVRVESGATLTIDPNGAETIDGATTKTITGPSSGRVHCNGSAFYTEGFASADVLTNPDNTTQTLTFGATTYWNMALGHIGVLTLTGNTTMAAPTNLKRGVYVLHAIQDASGGRTITWNSAFVPLGASSIPQPDLAPNARTVYKFWSDGTSLYHGAAGTRSAYSPLVTLSGAQVDFTNIPSWANRIVLLVHNANGTSDTNVHVRIGSGSIETTGYWAGIFRHDAESYSTGSFIVSTAIGPSYGVGHIVAELVNLNSNDIWSCKAQAVSSFSSGAAPGYIAAACGAKEALNKSA